MGATAASGGTQLLPSCTTLSQAATTPKVGLASQGWISAPAPLPLWLRLSRNPPSVIKRLCLLSSFPGSSWVQALVQSHHAVQKSREQYRTMAWRKQRESRHPAARLRSVTVGCVLSLCVTALLQPLSGTRRGRQSAAVFLWLLISGVSCPKLYTEHLALPSRECCHFIILNQGMLLVICMAVALQGALIHLLLPKCLLITPGVLLGRWKGSVVFPAVEISISFVTPRFL